MFFPDAELRFHCTGCGQCCLGHADAHYIELAAGEAANIRHYLGFDKKKFQRDILVTLDDKGKGIKINAHGRCVLLDENNRCSVYPVRPRQCMTYPFWPELLQSEQDWHAEAARCEGINQGAVVAAAHIKKQLKLLGS